MLSETVFLYIACCLYCGCFAAVYLWRGEAGQRGARFKLIGKLWRDGDQIRGSVAPEEVPVTHPLAGVSGATNAITITTDTLGDVTVVGPGAGRKETGFSALIDLISLGTGA